jgi:hypothetical protein
VSSKADAIDAPLGVAAGARPALSLLHGAMRIDLPTGVFPNPGGGVEDGFVIPIFFYETIDYEHRFSALAFILKREIILFV